MSRRNYNHSMDALIGKNSYSNFTAPTSESFGQSTTIPVTQPTRTAPILSISENEGVRNARPTIGTATPTEGTATPTEGTTVRPPRTYGEPTRVTEATEGRFIAPNPRTYTLPPVSGYPRPPMPIGTVGVATIPILATPVITSDGSAGGGIGGGGGSMDSETSKVAPVVEQKSFLRKNIIPIILIAGAAYFFYKKSNK
jgi:hypothetical protein